MEDMAMADATAIVTIFTVQLRCSGKMDVLRARLVTQTRGTLKASPHHKIRLFVHANVMDVRAQKRKLLAINDSPSAFRRNDRFHAAASFPHNRLAMRRARAA
jgi:hypothetical protein